MFKLLIVTAPQQKMPPGAKQTWRLTDLVNFGRFWEQSTKNFPITGYMAAAQKGFLH